ncbi:MAG: ribose 5-phosphate isomerase B [Rickettsia endosymbiont of Ixodes persulcatus]|nr:ribose 5-phosphate isomerase B [Rickettsia endosymbiont of Ixodes persulcatus]MCZ6901632.1 ribose 5-phosphate isomerase B [Rickettsia endosymbiont of Ixodes persulcatus]MCZ6903160.1 ribose 5-phosphate isomerase B [Rickettsia endosymbiont of Ixodes persulcatus]MCZ6909225.1 ribose 5-phosphate isomerase B [Rickettsia endosymbiont of Ixodes persulcatus]MCZ6911051.1 ribose 5-phosphate isomerase B [Rickettsia endosymbiont of Ixodes persulcatus]
MKTYNIVIASDHSGYKLKSKIIDYLEQKSLKIYDCGTNNTQTVDYPDYAKKVVNTIIEKLAPIGILINDTGIGMSIAANRSSEIRAALCNDILTAENAKAHNDANILILGAKTIDHEIVFDIIDRFLTTKFEGGRHSTRLSKIK